MLEDTKRIIIVSSCLVVLIVLVVGVLFVDVDLKIFKFNSINTLLGKYDEVKESEQKLMKKETEYNNAVKKVQDIQTTFDSEKTKYEAISDETINIIKEATKEENYNIEYMWIRLGNYAKSNNLSIVMAEPGGSFETSSANKDGSTSSTTKTNTASSSTTDKTNVSNTTSSATSDETTTGDATATSTETDTTNNNASTNTNKTTNATQNTNSNTIFKIQVTGSYLDVSDFIFEVENDSALRFKLDNISMDYVSGTTIRASFNVKNLIINK